MAIIPLHICLFRAHGADRVAFVSMQLASAGATHVQVARGPKRKSVSAKLYGPFADADVEGAYRAQVTALEAEGFMRSGVGALLAALDSKRRKKRALAALRLAWMREKSAVEPLVAAAAKAGEETPALLDALGELSDARAIPVARAAAEKKLLSRRRAGVEALWKLGDAAGLEDARQRAMERLPGNVTAALKVADTQPDAQALVDAVRAVGLKDRGLAIDTLYELRTPQSVIATRRLLGPAVGEPVQAPHLWRYAKSVLKRAMTRLDFETFGVLAHRVERLAQSTSGATATLKSGYDGETRETRVFGKKTQRYVLRSLWRFLSRLARHRPQLFALAAAEVLVNYTADDEATPHGLRGSYAGLYVFSRLVFGGSTRFKPDLRHLSVPFRDAKSAKVKDPGREEAHPTLWDASPDAVLRLLGGASLPVALEIGLRVARANPAVIANAKPAQLAALVGSAHEPVALLGLAELERRFDPAAPELELVRSLIASARPKARELGLEWLVRSRAAWVGDASFVVSLLATPDAAARSLVAERVFAALTEAGAGAPAAARRALAIALDAVLRAGEPTEGAHDAHARVAQAVVAEIAALRSTPELVAMLVSGSPSARSVAAAALGFKPDAGKALGMEKLVLLAQDSQAPVRQAAMRLFEGLLPELERDPSPLFALIEAAYPDVRTWSQATLAGRIALDALPFEAILGLCDSNQREAQDLGKELVLRRVDALPVDKLIAALAEHPHVNIRRFALELVVTRLKSGFVRLAMLEEFFRAVLLDVTPDRAMKRKVIEFVTERGLLDEHQAGVAARLLAEIAKSKTKGESERAVVGLARLKLAFPEVETPAFALKHAAAAVNAPGGAA